MHATDGGDVADPREPNIRLVIARVPLMPMSQSLSLRERAASESPAICSPSRSCSKASRMPSAVMVCIQARFTGSFDLVRR